MISNEGRYTRGPVPHYSDRQDHRPAPFDRPRPAFESLGKQVIEGPRKQFTLEHRRNANGEFIQVVEEGNGRRSMVVIPAEAAETFSQALAAMVQKIGTAAAAAK